MNTSGDHKLAIGMAQLTHLLTSKCFIELTVVVRDSLLTYSSVTGSTHHRLFLLQPVLGFGRTMPCEQGQQWLPY